jgi:CHAT domain-containing protein
MFALPAPVLRLLSSAAIVILAHAAPLAAQTADCETAIQKQQQARSRVGAVRGAPSLPASSAQRSTGALADRLKRRIAAGAWPARSALLFYAKGANDGFTICLVGPEGLLASAMSEGDQAALLSAIQSLRWAYEVEELQQVRAARRTTDPAPQPPAIPTPPRAAESKVARMLLPPPVASRLDGIEHLIIVPAGPIGTVPFPALKPFGDSTALVDRTSITLAPSLAEFDDGGSGWQADTAFSRPLVVGDPALPASDEWVIPPLPGAQAEARAVAKRLKTEALSSSQAQRSTVAERAPQASLIYVAAHGSSDPARPLDGGLLMLSGPSLETGWWTAREIQASNLDAELAVLSACQTGLGQAHEGGMIGLARAFQLAGTRRVIMSLWNVDDAATELLMTRLIVHAATYPPAEALRRAMIDTRNKHPDPALWASFLQFGSAR